MQFELSQAPEMLAPLVTDQALTELSIFGPNRADVRVTIETALKNPVQTSNLVRYVDKHAAPLPDTFHSAPSIAAKLRSLRAFIQEDKGIGMAANGALAKDAEVQSVNGASTMTLASNGLASCRDIHESLLATLVATDRLSREAQCVIDHAMLSRAKERYLFDAVTNRDVVSDDPWTRFVWDWIAGGLKVIHACTCDC